MDRLEKNIFNVRKVFVDKQKSKFTIIPPDLETFFVGHMWDFRLPTEISSMITAKKTVSFN